MHIFTRMNVKHDFISIEFVDLQGARQRRQIKVKNIAHSRTTNNIVNSSLMFYGLSYSGFDKSCPFEVTFPK